MPEEEGSEMSSKKMGGLSEAKSWQIRGSAGNAIVAVDIGLGAVKTVVVLCGLVSLLVLLHQVNFCKVKVSVRGIRLEQTLLVSPKNCDKFLRAGDQLKAYLSQFGATGATGAEAGLWQVELCCIKLFRHNATCGNTPAKFLNNKAMKAERR